MARCVLIADAAVWKDDSIASPIVCLLVHAPLELRLNARTVFRVNPIEPEWRSRDVLTRLNVVDALNLGRAFDDARCEIVPPASSTTESLHLEQKGLASPQRILGDLSVVDVGSNAVPARGAIVVIARPDGPDRGTTDTRRRRAAGAARVRPAGPSPTRAAVQRRAQANRPDVPHRSVFHCFDVGYAAAVVIPSGPVLQFHLTRHVVDRDQGWNIVEDRVELPLAGSQHIFGLLPILDVGDQVAPPNESSPSCARIGTA